MATKNSRSRIFNDFIEKSAVYLGLSTPRYVPAMLPAPIRHPDPVRGHKTVSPHRKLTNKNDFLTMPGRH